ncbi:hypothetical protein CPB83DRAFT_135243 [Crepidotus variabilis]|uniref:Uncharacterized protein n=1 Tax=Crepidotus variabilis TaxID=179855 RepID=A0A9P6E488_9AGAR|nr:hypothetical protein CPB83DRAFT_135243 [Crepidotus variabilis]
MYSTTPRSSLVQTPSPKSSEFTKGHRYYPSDTSTFVMLEKPQLSHLKTSSLGEEFTTSKSYNRLSLPPFTPFYLNAIGEPAYVDPFDSPSTFNEELPEPDSISNPEYVIHSHSRPPSQVPEDVGAFASHESSLEGEAAWRPQKHSLDVEVELHPGVYR